MITALIVEDMTSTPSLMRGLRIDLAHGEASPNCDSEILGLEDHVRAHECRDVIEERLTW